MKKPFALLLLLLPLLDGCTTTPNPSGGNPEEPKVFCQVYGFQLDERDAALQTSENTGSDEKYAETYALYGPAKAEFSLMRLLEGNGVDFNAAGSLVSIDSAANRALAIGTPYRRYYIVIANTPENLNKVDAFIRSKMNGIPVGPRKEQLY